MTASDPNASPDASRDPRADASAGADPTFVATPYGIGTDGGNWYHATREMLEAYAGAVFDHQPLGTLLRRADQWLDAPRTLTVWLLPVLLLALPPVWAASASAGGYVLLRILAPSVPHPVAARVIGWMRPAAVQGAYYVFTLSILAADEAFAALGIGLAGFVLLRWGLVDRALSPVLEPILRQLYPLPVPDQVLRGLIVRTALKHRLELPQLDEMAHEMMEMFGDSPDGSDDADDPTTERRGVQ
jgi:hypothetical protein